MLLRTAALLKNLQVSSRKFLLGKERLVPAIDMLNHRENPNTEYGEEGSAQESEHVCQNRHAMPSGNIFTQNMSE